MFLKTNISVILVSYLQTDKLKLYLDGIVYKRQKQKMYRYIANVLDHQQVGNLFQVLVECNKVLAFDKEGIFSHCIYFQRSYYYLKLKLYKQCLHPIMMSVDDHKWTVE